MGKIDNRIDTGGIIHKKVLDIMNIVVENLFQDLAEEISCEVYRDRQTLKERRA